MRVRDFQYIHRTGDSCFPSTQPTGVRGFVPCVCRLHCRSPMHHLIEARVGPGVAGARLPLACICWYAYAMHAAGLSVRRTRGATSWPSGAGGVLCTHLVVVVEASPT
jgi:hypothetical protein